MDFYLTEEPETQKRTPFSFKTFWQTASRVFRYSIVRIISVIATVGIGLYLMLLILNLGGYVDQIQEGQITEMIGGMAFAGAFDGMEPEERDQAIEALRWNMEEAMGLHDPLPIRTARWWFNGITLKWGNSERLSTLDQKSMLVKDIIFERIPYTLILVGGANIVLFAVNLWVAMGLARKQGKFWDKLISALTPISSVPSWIHGVLLLTLFALEFRILPFKGMFDGAPPEDTVQYALQLLKHLVLPVLAVVLSSFFQGVYTWRTFFLVHSGEDYVELAKAKGLPERVIRKEYILRPTLPSVITNFTMMLLSFWQEAIALEMLFNWTGLGGLFLQAVGRFDRPVVVGIVVMFAYLMGLSVILLDIIYALIDPRVRIGGQGPKVRAGGFRTTRLIPRLKRLFSHQEHPPLQPKVPRTEPLKLPVKESKASPALEVGASRPKVKKRDPFIKGIWKNLKKYPMAAIGIVVILTLFIVSIVTVIVIPYDEAVAYWHSDTWMQAPRLARPAWTNWFRREKWPESIYLNSLEPTEGVTFHEEWSDVSDSMTEVVQSFEFDFDADVFPQDMVVNFKAVYDTKAPFTQMSMFTPDGREIEIKNFRNTTDYGYVLSYEDLGYTQHKGPTSVEMAFGDPETDYTEVVKGTYTFLVRSYLFETGSDVELSATIHGRVYGLFGTDNHRRDLTFAMMWGTPVVLAFGILGSAVTALTILLAAVSAWFGGVVDRILQMVTEINFTIPALPVAILVYILYSQSVWVIMTIIVLMNIFGSTLKEYRAMFLQLKEAPYVEAAIVYGSSNFRIIYKYLLPRIIQVMIPQLVISVPGFVFLEATLAYLGVATPYLPTWGKVIAQALEEGTFQGHYFWVMEPLALALITGLAFAFFGFSLDKILNPRLRDL